MTSLTSVATGRRVEVTRSSAATFSRAAGLAAALACLAAPTASASVTVAAGGNTIQVVGSAGNDASVRLEFPSLTINNPQGVDLDSSAMGRCSFDPSPPVTKVTCDNTFSDLQAQFDASNDRLTVGFCFATASIEMGDGTNSYDGPACLDPVTFTVFGGTGPDDFAGSGDDQAKTVEQLAGNGGDDTLSGGAGDDVIDAGAGRDTVFGDCASSTCTGGNDQIFVRDGELDQAACGGGTDTVQADQLDVVSTDGAQACESVDRPTIAGSSSSAGGGPAAGPAAPKLKVAGIIRSKTLLKRGLALQVTCLGACRIVAKLRYKKIQLGSARKALLKAGAAKLAVKVPRKARRAMRRLKRGKLTLGLVVTDAAGKTTKLTRTIKLKR
jgi:hypothetical protein